MYFALSFCIFIFSLLFSQAVAFVSNFLFRAWNLFRISDLVFSSCFLSSSYHAMTNPNMWATVRDG